MKYLWAELSKRKKYHNLLGRFQLVPVAVETSDAIGTETGREVGRKIIADSADWHETAWMFQRISLAIVRGNAFSILSASHPLSSLILM